MDEVAITEGYTNWEEMYQKSFIFPERVVKAMKQAVNEAIQEPHYFSAPDEDKDSRFCRCGKYLTDDVHLRQL